MPECCSTLLDDLRPKCLTTSFVPTFVPASFVPAFPPIVPSFLLAAGHFEGCSQFLRQDHSVIMKEPFSEANEASMWQALPIHREPGLTLWLPRAARPRGHLLRYTETRHRNRHKESQLDKDRELGASRSLASQLLQGLPWPLERRQHQHRHKFGPNRTSTARLPGFARPSLCLLCQSRRHLKTYMLVPSGNLGSCDGEAATFSIVVTPAFRPVLVAFALKIESNHA